MTPDEARALIQRSLGPPGDGPEPDLAQAWGVLAADAIWRTVSNLPPTHWREELERLVNRAIARSGKRIGYDLAAVSGYVCMGCGAASPGIVPAGWICPECRADQAEHARPPF